MAVLPPTYLPDFHDKDVISQLIYSQLGDTDMIIPKLTFGSSALGSVFRSTDDAESIQVTEMAIKQGINMVDTAPWYGHGKSEKVLGEILPKLPRKAFYINTKVGRYEPEFKKMFDFSAEKVIQSVDESLKRLGLDYIDIIQIHDMEFAPSLDVILHETLPALQKVKESGKVRYIGITGYPLENFRTVIEKSTVHIDTILTYCRGSMNDNALQNHIPFFQSKGVGVINASLLSMGLLTNRGPASWHPAPESIRSVCKKAAEYCQGQHVDISRLATYFALSQPGIPTTLISTASLANLKKNLDVLHNGITDHEKSVSNEVMEKFFTPLNHANWEGVEVTHYRQKLKGIFDDFVLG